MRKILILLCMPLFAMAQTGETGFEINGNIRGLKDSTVVFLMSGTDGKTITTGNAMNGVFTLKGRLAGPQVVQVGFIGHKEAFDLFIRNEKVSVNGDLAAIANVHITGSPVQQDYELFKQRFNPTKDKLNELAGLINPEKDPRKRDSLIGRFNKYKRMVMADAGTFVKEKPASPVSSFVLFILTPLMESLAELEDRYNALQPIAKKGFYAGMIEKTIADSKVGAVGTQALLFTQNDQDNKPVSLASFKGRYVLVDFWASWCRPCRAENPNVVNAYQAFKNRNFTVLGVSLDESRDKWIEAIKADRLTWAHVSDLKYWNNAVAQLYRIQGIPANMLIDPSGKIIARDLRGEELHRRLKELLK